MEKHIELFQSMPNALGILGLEEKATQQEIKSAYKELAIVYHPDKNKDKKTSHFFLKIKDAYQILTNPELREEYNLFWSSKNIAAKIFEAEKKEKDFLQKKLAQKEKEAKIIEQTKYLNQKKEKQEKREEDNEYLKSRMPERQFEIDKSYYCLNFSWSSDIFLVDSEIMKCMFEQFGIVNMLEVDLKKKSGVVEFSKLKDCENALAYLRENDTDFTFSYFLKKKRIENLDVLGKIKFGNLGLTSETLETLFQNNKKRVI